MSILDELFTFPDPIALVTEYLDPLITAPVAASIPEPRPDAFVVVNRTGGPRPRNVVLDQPLLAIDCWADTDEDAQDLTQLVRGHLRMLPGRPHGDVTVYRVNETLGPARTVDAEAEQTRYTFTVQVTLRGARATGS